MRDDRHQFLTLAGRLPARLTVEQSSWMLNCQVHDIPILVAARLLRPLGNPKPNSIKFFATTDVLEFAADRSWLAKMTTAINDRWLQQNARKRSRLKTSNSQTLTDGHQSTGLAG